MIDLDTVERNLKNFVWNTKIIVEGKMVKLTPMKQKMHYLSEAYPSLYVFILEFYKMNDRIAPYMTRCKAYENNQNRYSLYVHGYFLVWLDQ